MDITNEIIAKYVDGTATPEEVSNVRQYLVQHPEEREGILMLMDDHEDYLNEWDEEFDSFKESVFSDVMMSAAAFAPTKMSKPKRHHKQSKDSGFFDRMSNMLDELNRIE